MENLEVEFLARRFADKLASIYTWLIRTKKVNPEYVYDNHTEFANLMVEFQELNDVVSTKEVEIMSVLEADIELSKQPIEKTRNETEEAFYKKIVGINTWLLETKENDPNYIFDNIAEVDGLLVEFESLKTNDSSIKTIIQMLTKDGQKTLQRTDLEETKKYTEKLNSLGINLTNEMDFSK